VTGAYLHASAGLRSPEIRKLQWIDRFGVEAVTGRRQLYYGETQRMITAENIVFAYRSRAASEDWGAWAQKYPDLEKLLIDVEMLVNT
jgi:hypothetical protein